MRSSDDYLTWDLLKQSLVISVQSFAAQREGNFSLSWLADFKTCGSRKKKWSSFHFTNVYSP